MKTLKILVLSTITTMIFSSYCLASEYDCDGMTVDLCHINSTYVENGNIVHESDGDQSVMICSSSIENQGNCAYGSLFTCHWTKSWTDSVGIFHNNPESTDMYNHTCS